MKLKLVTGKFSYFGCYSPGRTLKSSEDSYCWQDVINYEKESFIFYTFCGETNYSQTTQASQQMLSLCGGQYEKDKCMIFYEKNAQIVKLSFSNSMENQLTFLNLAGSTVDSIEVFSGVLKPTISQPKFLSSINKSFPPFTYYRTTNIYILPQKLTYQKFENITFSKLINKDKKIKSNQMLGNVVQQSNDFIVDIQIQIQQSDQNHKQQLMELMSQKIFNMFSELGGPHKVLEVGFKSVKEWKKTERRKCFQHYMSEVKNFAPLPNFLSHFIKHQQSITFLLQVTSGMPDDPNSQRNWEQEQAKFSKHIYKMLADVYKYDRSVQSRDMNKYSQFCQFILDKLAEISKQTIRVNKQHEQDISEQIVQGNDKGAKLNAKQKKKKKGIGYSNDNQNNSKWTATQWMEHRKNMSEEIYRVTTIFAYFLDCEKPLTDKRLSQLIKNSCLLPLIESSLRSGSLLDITKQSDLFKNYLHIIKSLANNYATIDCLLPLQSKYKPVQTDSILKLLTKLNRVAQIFLDCLKSGKQTQENQVAALIASQIEKTYLLAERAVKNIAKRTQTITMKQINNMPTSQAYRLLLSGLRFGYMDMKVAGKDEYTHFFSSTIPKGIPATSKILRISQEFSDLSSSLPCQNTNSIFARCDKTRIDVIRVMVMGSKDTPYSNGAFVFDLLCDDGYPNNPPKMSIVTTGHGKIRFNPNLYSCGRVCLSLLGTWRGQATENWDPKVSTLLQLFISTQSMIMSEDLYFNQPGFDGEQGTVEGQKKNEGYSNIAKIGNLRYAMIEQIKSPPKGFEEIINRHFYIKKKQICQEIQKWIAQADTKQANYTGLVNDHNNVLCGELKNKGKYKQALIKEYDELKGLLQKLPEPNLQQKQEQINFQAQKARKHVKAKELKLGQIDVSYNLSSMKQLVCEEDVIQDRWSRYIGAMGMQAVKKQAESRVIIIGLKPLGLEIAKNLVLSGLKQLCIVDQNSYEMGNEEHFYMSDIKTKNIQSCIYKIKQLNPYMLVKWQKQIPNISNYSVVVCTQPLKTALQISSTCRKANVKFIYAQTCGVSGVYFADFGKEFIIEDTTGQEPFEGMIKEITCEQEGLVKLLDGVKHQYQDGDFVVINQVEGMNYLQANIQEISFEQAFYNKMTKVKQSNSINGKVFKVKVKNWNSFTIGDTSNFTPYIKNGICKKVNVPKKVQYMSLEECIQDFSKYLDESVSCYDYDKCSDNYSIFACFKAFSNFIDKHKRKPKNWQLLDQQQFTKILKDVVDNDKKSEEQAKLIIKFGEKYSLIAQAELPVIGAYFGGLISQQIIKSITNKYAPIKQFYTFHFNELTQQIPALPQDIKRLQVQKSQQFPNMKIVIGRERSKKIQQMNIFVIGAGAIGCQLLKNFAMLNMGVDGMITVTDPDHIQTSNLTRQFLFRQKHVKKPKVAIAAATLIQMNANLKNHISARLDKVSEQTEDIYSDQFFQSQTVIANALDNVRARVYIDSRCVTNSKPLFESGTLGPKGHVQVIVPFKTQNYSSKADPTQQNQIPHCTLKMFPEQTVHCIEWSRDLFGKIFTLNPKALKKVIQGKDLTVAEGLEKLTVTKMIQHRPKSFQDCVAEAVRKFYKYFRNNVRQLIHTYPLGMKDKQGKPFWTLPKRPPKQIETIDFEDATHQKFIASYAVLYAKVYQIAYPKNFRKEQGIKKVIQIAKQIKPQQFIPSEQQSQRLHKIVQNEQTKQDIQQIQIQQSEKQKKEQNEPKITLTKQILNMVIKPEQFEKDEDENGHIDLIYSMSNLRARNYGLNECTWIDAKLKAGKIMAALSTTTSVVAALQTIQIVKLVIGCKNLRNAFINLALPLIQITEPGEPSKHKVGNTQFSVWDTWQFKASTLKDLLKQIEDKYGVQGYNLSTAAGVPIYWQTMYIGKESAAQQLLAKPLSKLFQDKTALNVLMRQKQSKKPYENVPRIIIYPQSI